MPIQDSDLLLIEDTSGVSKKITASKLKENLAADTYLNYKLLVNKPDYSSRFVYAQNMQQSVAPTDYMLVERSGVSYKVNGQQIIDYFPTVPAGAAGAIVDVENTAIDGAWTFTQPYTEARWEGITFGLGMFVAVSKHYGQVWTSSDNGATWTKRYELPNAEWRSVTFGNGRFVAVSDGADTIKAIYSDDGVTWSAASNQLNQPWQSVAYGNGRYVAVGHSTGRSMYSTDGSSWTIGYMDSQYWTRVAYGGDKFVAVNNTNGKYIAYSTDGASWTEVIFDPAEVYRWTSLAYGNGEFIANTEGGNTTIMCSSDGVNWSLRDMGINNAGRSGTFGGGKFVFAYGSKVVYSTNAAATTWAETTVEGGAYQDIAYGNGYFVAVDQGAGLISRSYGGTGKVVLESELTLAAEDNLELFATGDAIRMVNEDGDVASYTPVTSAITNVSDVSVTVTTRDVTNGQESITADTEGLYNGTGDIVNSDKFSGGEITLQMALDISASPVLLTSNIITLANGNGSSASTRNSDLILNFTDGTEIINSDHRIGAGTYNPVTYTLDSSVVGKSVTRITWKAYRTQNEFIYISELKLNGEFLFVPVGTKLSLASPNQDLKYFNTGDVVQTNPAYFILGDTEAVPWAATDKGVNNYYELFNGGGSSQSKSVKCKRYFPSTGTLKWSINPQSQSVQNGPAYSWWCDLYYRSGGPGGTQQTARFGFRNDGNNNSATSRTDFTLDLSTLGVSELYVDEIQYVLADLATWPNGSSNTSSLIYGLTLDDVLIIAYQAAVPGEDITSVVSTDTAANTMVVNGGDWSNGDVVTAPEKSGVGNFNGNTEVVIDVSNSNQQWISDDNRLGEAFYIKPASTVNGLATARSLAEANALSWSSSESYLEGDWVIYGGYYWRAMEYNINVVPSSANFEEWLGFGPI